MYIPDIYKNQDKKQITNFIIENSFAILISQVQQKIVASHIPLFLDQNNKEQDLLYGHISIQNPNPIT